MLRCSRCAPAAAVAATAALAAAFWAVPAPPAGAQVPAAAQAEAAAGGRAEIWHTGTAGATWQVQWEGAGSPLSITATDPSHAWALIACRAAKGARPSCGRELLATADGGRRWRVVVTLPQAVNQVQFASAHLGVATSDSCLVNLGQSRCPGQILVSRDGGARWTPVLNGAAPVFAGTPKDIADQMEAWFTGGAGDGFNLMFPVLPDDWMQFAERVVPELQRRGIARKDYGPGTLRERLGLPRPTNRFATA